MTLLRKYLPFLVIPTSIAVALIFASCSSTTSVSTSDGTVQMQSQLAANSAQLPYTSKNPAPQSIISSVTVTQVELFIKDIKLHRSDEDTAKDHDVKTGPMVVVFDSLGSHIFTTTTIPAGIYDRIKFELHHPNGSADQALLATYPDFASGNKTYTIVIKGYTTSPTGVKANFMARSESSHNYEIKFKKNDGVYSDMDSLVVSGGVTTLLTLQFDPRIVFHLNGQLSGLLFDPNDTSYQDKIDANVVSSLRVVKN
jgi:hypothetical protein